MRKTEHETGSTAPAVGLFLSSWCPPHTDNCTLIVNNSRKVYPYRYRHGISSDAPGCDMSALRRGAISSWFDGILRSPCVLRLLCASCRAWSRCAVHSLASDLRLSRCRGSWARCLLVLASVCVPASAVVRLLRSVAHGVPPLLVRSSVGSCAGHGGQAVRGPLSMSARCPAPGLRIISAGLLLFMGSRSSLLSLFMGLLSLFYRSSVHTHIGIIYIIYTILCMMIFRVIQGIMIYSNSMNTQ